MILHFNFPKLFVNNSKLLKSEIVKVSRQFKSESAKGELYNILIVNYLNWSNILDIEKWKSEQTKWD